MMTLEILQASVTKSHYGMSFWPILQMHIEKSFIDVGRNVVVIKPGRYYTKRFPNMDVIVTLYRHTFHHSSWGDIE